MILKGVTGEIRWSYLPAAVFGPWRVETQEDTALSTLTGTLVSVDGYRVTQSPLVAVVSVGRRRLTWPITDMQISGDTITAVLGLRQEDR